VVAIDAKRVRAEDPLWAEADEIVRKDNGDELDELSKNFFWEVYIHGGRTPTGINALEWAKKVERNGAGEILLTSMDRDGTNIGYDLPLNRVFSDSLSVPVIASGGAGTLEHLRDALVYGKADAVLAASIFHYRKHTIKEAKEYLKMSSLPVRIG